MDNISRDAHAGGRTGVRAFVDSVRLKTVRYVMQERAVHDHLNVGVTDPEKLSHAEEKMSGLMLS
jgi:hypothetical protein